MTLKSKKIKPMVLIIVELHMPKRLSQLVVRHAVNKLDGFIKTNSVGSILGYSLSNTAKRCRKQIEGDDITTNEHMNMLTAYINLIFKGIQLWLKP